MRMQTLAITALSAYVAAAGVATAKASGTAQTPARPGLLGGNLGAKWRLATKNFGLKPGKPILGARSDENDGDEDEDGEMTLSYSESAGEVIGEGDAGDAGDAGGEDVENGEDLVARAEVVPKHRKQGVYYELTDTGAAVLGKRNADEEEDDVTLSYDEAAGEVEKRDVVAGLDEEVETGESWSPGDNLMARDVEDDEDDEDVDYSLEGYDHELAARDVELDDEEEDGTSWTPEDADAKLTARDVDPEDEEEIDYSLEGYDHELVARDSAPGIGLDDEVPDGPTWSPGDKLTARDLNEDDGEEIDYSLEGYDHELVARDAAEGIGLDDEVPDGPTWSPGDKLTARDLAEEDGEEEIDYSLEGYDTNLVARDASYGHLHQETGNHPRDVHEGADDDDADVEDEEDDEDEEHDESVIAARALPMAPAKPRPGSSFAQRQRGHGFHRGFHSKLFRARKTKAAGH